MLDVYAQDGLIHKDEFALALFKLQVCNKNPGRAAPPLHQSYIQPAVGCSAGAGQSTTLLTLFLSVFMC